MFLSPVLVVSKMTVNCEPPQPVGQGLPAILFKNKDSSLREAVAARTLASESFRGRRRE